MTLKSLFRGTMWTYLFLRIIKADKMGQFQLETNRQLPHNQLE